MPKQIYTRTITKADIQEKMYEEQERYLGLKYLSKSDAKEATDFFVNMISESIIHGEIIYFRNIGRIKSTYKPGGRPVRNPKTKETMKMSDTVQVSFLMTGSATPTDPITKNKLLSSDMIRILEAKFGTEKVAQHILNQFFWALREVRDDGARLEFRGLGSFFKRIRPERIGRNPKTGDSVEVEKKDYIHFRIGKGLQSKVNDFWVCRAVDGEALGKMVR